MPAARHLPADPSFSLNSPLGEESLNRAKTEKNGTRAVASAPEQRIRRIPGLNERKLLLKVPPHRATFCFR